MAVRCKLKVWSVVPSEYEGKRYSETVRMQAVIGPEGSENKSWSEATPYASFEFAITNAAAFGSFKEGKEYFADFTPAE